jgi:hypothetical protein
MLQQVKKELENQNAAVENVALSQENKDDSEETLESLLCKLASASIDDIKAANFGAEAHQENDAIINAKEDEIKTFDDEDADLQIHESILVLFITRSYFVASGSACKGFGKCNRYF